MTTTFEYEDTNFRNLWTRRTQPTGDITERDYDDSGNLIRETITTSRALPTGNPSSSSMQFEYFTSGAADGLIKKTTDAIGVTTDFAYDNLGRLLEKKFADGSELSEYSSLAGNVTRFTDPDGFAIDRTYDEMNRLDTTTVVVSVDGITYTTDADYDAEGNLVVELDRNGNETHFYYDVLDRPIERHESVGELDAITEFGYEFGAMQAAASVPNNPDFNYRYEKDAAGGIWLYVEDKLGQNPPLRPTRSVEQQRTATTLPTN